MIKQLSKEDLYDGRYVSIYPNRQMIYILNIEKQGIFGTKKYFITGSHYANIYGVISPVFSSKHEIVSFNLCESIYTKQLNIPNIREQKIKELGL